MVKRREIRDGGPKAPSHCMSLASYVLYLLGTTRKNNNPVKIKFLLILSISILLTTMCYFDKMLSQSTELILYFPRIVLSIFVPARDNDATCDR